MKIISSVDKSVTKAVGNSFTFSYFPRSVRINFALALFSLGAMPAVHADGMVPQTSVVIVEEATGEASIQVTNSDATPALLHVKVLNIPSDTQPLLLVTPAVSRVEPGQAQLVRFILRTDQGPLRTQRLKRVTFEGIPQLTEVSGQGRIGVGIRQNLPVIIHPAGLAPNREPWLALEWTLRQGTLTVRNDSPYIVRLSQQIEVLPAQVAGQLPRSYILPNESLAVAMDAPTARASHVRLYPATLYGFASGSFDARLHE